MKWRRLFGLQADLREGAWRPGDLAVCRVSGPWSELVVGTPQRGEVLKVAAVLEHDEARAIYRMLSFVEKPAGHAWDARGFSKVVRDGANEGRAARRSLKDLLAGSGSRPVTTPLPAPSEPALEPAGALPRQPETTHA